MRDIQKILKLAVPVLAVAVLAAACTKTEETPPTPAEQGAPAKPAPTPSVSTPTHSPSAATASQPTAAPVATPTGNPAQEAAVIENAYVANPEFSARVENIYKLTDAGTPEAISVLGRLFQMEKDPELRTEILDSLFDIDGQDERKAALFAAGAASNQPKEVRQSAVDGLEDIDAKYALPILQSLTTDPDEDIRDAAKDAIESLQAVPATPAAPAQMK
jgi:hypothetical protein